MKQNLLKTLLILLVIGLATFLTAQPITIDLGEGTEINTTTGAAPFNIYFKSIRTQTVYTATELNEIGFGGPAELQQIGYYVTGAPIYPMPNFIVRIKHTTAANAGAHDPGPFTTVYTNASLMPTAGGWYMLEFSTPFEWNGVDNILIDTAFGLLAEYNSSGQQYIYAATNGMRFTRSDLADQTEVATTTAVNYKPQIRMVFEGGSFIQHDMAATAIVGPTSPTQGTVAQYTITVQNIGQIVQDNYTVKLMQQGGIELNSIVGTQSLQQGQTTDYTLSWTPGTTGATYLYGEVIIPDDENEFNNVTPNLNVVVMPSGTLVATIGTGEATNDTVGAAPINIFYRSLRSQTVYTVAELNAAGIFGSNEMMSIAYYVTGLPNLPLPNFTIRVKHTMANDASAHDNGPFELVYQNASYMPVVGEWNMLAFTTPFVWNGVDNILIDTSFNMVESWSSSGQQRIFDAPNGMRYVRSDTTDQGDAATTTAVNYKPQIQMSFQAGATYENDMAATSITGPLSATAGAPSTYQVTVRNMGSETQNNYTVKLMTTGDVELASYNATTPLGQYEMATFDLMWTPAAEGVVSIWGRVVLTGDEFAANDNTQPISVTVYPAGTATVIIGTGTTTSYYIPWNFFYMNSVSQTIYYDDEIYVGGLITHITFFNNFVTNLPGMPVAIWIGETEEENLAAGFIPINDHTLVFDGLINFPSGQNEISIELQEPFFYGSGNIVATYHRPMDTDYYSSSDVFYYTATPQYPNRSRYLLSDSTVFDPYNLTGGTPINNVPNTRLSFTVSDMGSLEGYVYDFTTDDPMQGVTISIEGYTMTQTTNAMGHFFFGYVPVGTHNITASKFGYYDETEEVTIIDSETTYVEFYMQTLPTVSVSGSVVGSDAPGVGLVGAVVDLTGYEDYQTETDADGEFTIPGVYADHTYTINVTYAGYQAYSAPVVVGSENVVIPTITLDEIAFPPSNVIAEVTAQNNVDLIWNTPGTGVSVEFRYDDGVHTGQLGSTGGTNTTVLGAVHRRDAQIHEVTWTLTGEGGPHAAVNVFIFGLNAAGMPNGADILFSQMNVPNVDLQWNVLELPEPIDAPNGFLVGLSYAGFLGLATDDGLGEPWAFVPNTQFFTADYTGNVWAPIEDYAFLVNYLIRAVGYDYGPLDRTGEEIAVNREVKDSDQRTRREAIGLSAGSSLPTVMDIEAPVYRSRLADAETPVVRDSRALEGYIAYRFLEQNQGNENLWTELATITSATDTTCTDTEWATLEAGVYKYAIKAIYTNNVLSAPAFSNALEHSMTSLVTVNLSANSGDPVTGATVTLTNNDMDPNHVYTMTSPASGILVFPNVWRGTYKIEAHLAGHEHYEALNVAIMNDTFMYSIELVELLLPVVELTYDLLSANSIRLDWLAPGTSTAEPIMLRQHSNVPADGYYQQYNTGYGVVFDLASYPGATLHHVDFRHSPWGVFGTFQYKIHIVNWATFTTIQTIGPISTTLDNGWEMNVELPELAGTGGLMGILIEAMSNSSTDAYPCIDTDGTLDGYSVIAPVTDWSDYSMSTGAGDFLIDLWIVPANRNEAVQAELLPASHLRNGADLRNAQPERALLGYKVMRNTTVLVENLDLLTYTDTDVPNGTYVYSVIAQYSSGESEAMMTDEITFLSADDDPVLIPLVTELQGNYPNPFNPDTKINFSLNENSHVVIDIYNVKGQKVRTLVNNNMEAGYHSVIWNGRNDQVREAGSGIFFYRMKAGTYSSTKKMILMK